MNTKSTIDIIIENVKKLRSEKGWNRTHLAREAGVDPSYISRLEAGGRGLTIDTLDKIAGAFEVKTYTILEPSKIEDLSLQEKFEKMKELPELKQMMVDQMIDAFLKEHFN